MEPTPPTEESLVGRTIAGKYELIEVHAGGVFGTVYKAHQHFCRQFVRSVAVKISRQTGLTETTCAALFSDAIILARLMAGGPRDGKQHLVPIYDMGLLPELDGRGYLVMEYVEGFPLLAHIQAAGRIGVATGLRYVKEICRGLAVLHSQGAVHLDLKPDNVLIDRSGVVRLIDFGLASFTDPHLGFVAHSVGTFAYMAPETLRGRSTPAADVYGMGLLMYELFTGGGPHLTAPWPKGDQPGHGDEASRIKESLRFAPPSASANEIRNEYRWLDALLLRCLDTDPGRRFRDAGRLLAAIEACEAGGEMPPPDEASPPSRTESRRPLPPSLEPSGRPTILAADDLFREVRRLLAGKQFAEVVDKLDVHRPAEWVTVDPAGARVLRFLGQAYLGRGDWRAARDCLEQLRAVQKEQALLPRQEYAAALSDLVKCYRALGFQEHADACQEEARRVVQEGK